MGYEKRGGPNRRDDWCHDWGAASRAAGLIDEIHATYPRDGRETIYDEYEHIMPTRTVREFWAAHQRVRDRGVGRTQDPDLPDDFGEYLTQRIPSYEMLRVVDDPDTEIDRYGQLVHRSPDEQDA